MHRRVQEPGVVQTDRNGGHRAKARRDLREGVHGHAPRRRRLLLQRRMREPGDLRAARPVRQLLRRDLRGEAAPIPLGGDCSSPLQYQDCIEGTVCAADATGGGSCKVPLAAGARCGPYDRCVRPYQCGGIDPVTSEGTCTGPPGQGQACDMSGNCDDSRDYCDRTTNMCTSRIAVGDPCSAPEGCISYATCDGTTCVAMPGPGSSCDPAAVDSCSLSLSCDTTMHCALPPPAASCR